MTQMTNVTPEGEQCSSAARRPANGAVLAMVLVTGLLVLLAGWAPTGATRPEPTVPLASGGWSGHDLPRLSKAALDMLVPQAYVWREYGRGKDIVLFTVLYGRDKRTFHSPGFCLLGEGWNTIGRGRKRVHSAAGDLVFNSLVIQRGQQQALVMYSFFQGRRSTPSLISHQARLLADRVLRRRETGALLRVVTPVTTTTRRAEAVAAEFLSEFIPQAVE
jgi:EpsI family protein